jgi:hypothetical protein
MKGDISTMLNVLLFLFDSWWLLEGFDDRAEAEGITSIWACREHF